MDQPPEAADPHPDAAAPTRQDAQPRPLVDLTAHTRAAQAIADRSRSEGVWSLGHLRICWLALGVGGVLLAVRATGNSCPGLYAAVGEPGSIRVGDRVEPA